MIKDAALSPGSILVVLFTVALASLFACTNSKSGASAYASGLGGAVDAGGNSATGGMTSTGGATAIAGSMATGGSSGTSGVTAAGGSSIGVGNTGSGGVSFKTFPLGRLPLYSLAVDASGNIWATSEIGYGTGAASVFRFIPSSGIASTFGVAGTSNASGTKGSLAIDASGNVWLTTSGGTEVTDPSTALVELSPSGSILNRFFNQGPMNPNPCPDQPCLQNPFSAPESVAIDPSGNLWVTDDYGGSTYLTELTPSGGFVRTVAINGASAPYVNYAAIDSAGDLWAIDLNDVVVAKVNPSGLVSGPFALPAGLQGATMKPAIDKNGNVWIATVGSFGSGSLVEISPSGSQLANVPMPSSGTADGIAIDSANALWVMDNTNLTLWQFDTSGVVVNHFANVPRSAGPAIGNNLVIDAGGSLWIAASAQDSTGMLIEAPGLAQGPQYFPYVGPEFPY